MANIETKNDKYYIPMEVSGDIIGINEADIVWRMVGSRRIKVAMIPVNEEQYHAYMRSVWREDKDGRRHIADSVEKLTEEDDYEFISPENLEDEAIKRLLIAELHKALAELDEIDRKIMDMYSRRFSEAEIGSEIGMSQRSVSKRKNKALETLKKRLKEKK